MGERAEWANEDEYEARLKLDAYGVGIRDLLWRDTSRRFHDLMDAAMLVLSNRTIETATPITNGFWWSGCVAAAIEGPTVRRSHPIGC